MSGDACDGVDGGERRLGRHRYRIEGDTIAFVQQGFLHQAEVEAIHAEAEALLAARGGLFFLLDVTQGRGTAQQSIRWMARWHTRHRVSGVALFGFRPGLRVLLELMARGVSLLLREPWDHLLARDEAEARAWIAGVRARRG